MIKNKPAVFLDRDGVLIVDHGYVHKVEDVEVFSDVVEGLKSLKGHGFLLFVVTNQSGVAREYFQLEDVHKCHNELDRQIGSKTLIDKYYICPHHPKGSSPEFGKSCQCRKPSSGLIDEASKDFSIDLEKSFIIGDKSSDIQCGMAVKIPGIQIDHGQYSIDQDAAAVVRSFKEAVAYITTNS